MVKLHILAYQANQNSRFYPFAGYLGLTPIVVDGVVRTKLEQDKKPVQAFSVTVAVKCIETRHGRLGVVHSNVLAEYSHTLWTPSSSPSSPTSPTSPCADIGDSEHPFRIVIPADAPGFSCANFQEYRVSWRVEAVLSHAPIFGVGNRIVKFYELSFIRHDAPTPSRIAHLPPPTRLLLASAKGHPSTLSHTNLGPRGANPAPLVRYQLLTPTHPVGPMDIVTIPLTLLPRDPHLHVRSISLLVERRIELTETAALPSPPLPPPSAADHNRFGGAFSREGDENSSGSTVRPAFASQSTVASEDSASTIRLGPSPGYDTAPSVATFSTASLLSSPSPSSTASLLPHQPLVVPSNTTDLPAKSIVSNVASVDAPGPFARGPVPPAILEQLSDEGAGQSGAIVRTLTLQWPAPKSHSHWAMGETMQTDMVRVRFYIKTKVIVSTPASPASTLELEERELFLISTNDFQRTLAMEKYRADQHARRSRSRSSHHSKSSANLRNNQRTAEGAGSSSKTLPEMPSRRSGTTAGSSKSNNPASSSLSSFTHSLSPSPCPSPSPSASSSPFSSRDADIDQYGIANHVPTTPKSASSATRSFFRRSGSKEHDKDNGKDKAKSKDKGKAKAENGANGRSHAPTSFRRPHTSTGTDARPRTSAGSKSHRRESEHPPAAVIASSWGLASTSSLHSSNAGPNPWASKARSKTKRPGSSSTPTSGAATSPVSPPSTPYTSASPPVSPKKPDSKSDTSGSSMTRKLSAGISGIFRRPKSSAGKAKTNGNGNSPYGASASTSASASASESS